MQKLQKENAEKKQQIAALQGQLEELELKKAKHNSMCSKENLLKLLSAKIAELDKECSSIEGSFKNGTISLTDFLEKYHKVRYEYHRQNVKKQIISKN